MKTKILSFLSEDIKKDVTIHSKINLIRKIILILVLGCLSQYGFSINPVDPPVKTGDDVKTTASQPVAPKVECSEICSMVSNTVVVIFDDCPNYTCEAKDSCTFYVCIYDNLFNPITCKLFNPVDCSYTFFRIMAEEGTTLHSKLVPIGTCNHAYNTGWGNSSSSVPFGGGTVTIHTKFCQ